MSKIIRKNRQIICTMCGKEKNMIAKWPVLIMEYFLLERNCSVNFRQAEKREFPEFVILKMNSVNENLYEPWILTIEWTSECE